MISTETLRTDIIPITPRYYELGEVAQELDYKAIACFAALGFFLADDTHFKNTKAYKPSTTYTLSKEGAIISSQPHFTWFHEPRSLSFHEAVEEFTFLFERIVRDSVRRKNGILPISGGLDSRTLAAALQGFTNVQAYSYAFQNGLDENAYGAAIAGACGFPFTALTIPRGYLWPVVEEIAQINGCFADFSNPRQMAVLPQVKALGDTFLLGHWGDVLFDDMGAAAAPDFETQVALIKRKILKRRGAELAESLWEAWGLSGTFEKYLDEKVSSLLEPIQISNPDARVRAFKSIHWATRWTSSNLTLFSSVHDAVVPYFHDDMCKFICTVPEEYLAGRQIQIAYLKEKATRLAAIPWQKYAPCNLFTYKDYTSPRYLPYRVGRRIRNEVRNAIGRETVTSNWQLQFLGTENDRNLQAWLFNNSTFSSLIPKKITRHYYDRFRAEGKEYHHPVNMLLTLSLFSKLKSHAAGVP